MWIRRFNNIVVLILALAYIAPGQSTQGGIVGTIRDEKGADISGAKVRVTNAATGLRRETTTAENGLYRVLAVPTGVYEVTAEAQGFATTTPKTMKAGGDQVRTLDLALRDRKSVV